MTNSLVGRPMEILLVEDTLADARVTIDALRQEKLRCRVSLVVDGQEALDFLHRLGPLARAPRPDLILLDMELPKKDGRDVLCEIRDDPDLAAIPVVVLTASRVHRALLEAEHLHVDAFLTKPVSWDKFLEVVKTLRRSWLDELVATVGR